MPIYNVEAFISDSIRSVIKQSFQDWELIVVDDVSADTSVDCVKALCAEDDRIRLIELERNSGSAIARNTAIEHSKGRYIAFLDGDDLWLPHKLERQLTFMQETDTAFSYSAYARIDEAGQNLPPVGVPEKLRYQDLLKTCYVGCLTAIYDTNVFGKRFMPLIRQGQDFALWLDLLRSGKEAKGLNELLAIYRVRPHSISANKIKGSSYIWYIFTRLEQMSRMKAAFYFGQYAIRGVIRRYFPNVALVFGVLHRLKRL
jgi:teichuronic acid biosynthesis glycosyltransferase TuaG